jgi:hypothetical protein
MAVLMHPGYCRMLYRLPLRTPLRLGVTLRHTQLRGIRPVTQLFTAPMTCLFHGRRRKLRTRNELQEDTLAIPRPRPSLSSRLSDGSRAGRSNLGSNRRNTGQSTDTGCNTGYSNRRDKHTGTARDSRQPRVGLPGSLVCHPRNPPD